jgi:putative acetyltransferase
MKIFEGRRDHCCDFVIFVDQTHQGKGIGTKLMKKILTTAKSRKLKRIELGVFSDNLKATKFYEKFGFVKEGVRKKSLQRNNKLHDEIIMAKLI